MIKHHFTLFTLLLLCWLFQQQNAKAELIYSDTLNGSDIIATTPWGTASLFYSVEFDSNTEFFTYTYTFTPNHGRNSKDLSHLIIELSNNFDVNTIESITGTSNWEINTYDATSQGSSNPGIPSPLYGIKFNQEVINTFVLRTTIAPQWGDFYAKDGKHKGDDVYMYNSGWTAGNVGELFLDDPTILYSNRILRPDTLPNGGGGGQGGEEDISEPNILSLILAGIIIVGRRFYLKHKI